MTPDQNRSAARAIVAASPDLVAYLDTEYPAKAPNPLDPEREIWMKAGERRLVDRLLALRAEATSLDKPVLGAR